MTPSWPAPALGKRLSRRDSPRPAGADSLISALASRRLAGGILGFSGLSQNKSFVDALFPLQSKRLIDVIATVGVMFFLFIVGVKTDLTMMRKSGKKVAAIGLISCLVPLALMASVGYLLRHRMPRELVDRYFIYQLAATWARTSYAVVSTVLEELNLLNSRLGRLAMTATLISEFNSTVFNSINTAIQLGIHARSRLLGIGSFVSFLALLAFILLVARPITLWMVRRTPEGEHLREGYFIAVVMMVLTCGLAGELIGHHAATGTFLLGLALPGGPPLGSTLQDRFGTMVSGILVPLFMASAGFRSTIFDLVDMKLCGYVICFILLGALGKTLGVVVPALMPFRDAMTLALMMNTKGIFEVHSVNIWSDASLIDQQVYTVIVICVVAFSTFTTSVVKILYKPATNYRNCAGRTVEHARGQAELRVLACVHNEDDVSPMVDILKLCHPTKESPMCVYALHIVPFAGHSAAKLAPYRKQANSGSFGSATDRIMNAFRFFEEEVQGAVLVQPFVAIAPAATNDVDVCTLAMDKKVSFVVLPFHKRRAVDGTMELDNALKNMNMNVLSYAPCSVGIFIYNNYSPAATFFAPGKPVLHYNMAVYFLGGPDDREALAIAVRAAENPLVGLTVIRLLPPEDRRRHGPEEALDEEALSEFRLGAVDDDRVVYQEEVVQDSEGTIGLLRETSCRFSMLIVGRRSGTCSTLTEGLSMFCDHPELGVLGDVLASRDVVHSVPTLVVQQQTRRRPPSSDVCLPVVFSQRSRVEPC
ncbi:hypothetical protein Taro_052047 [Colocasia esculenta]|uniref:Cation/H+ exchanger domain-containing protein n=1 Tax=Colocasia esculenta TaxID=4460 RepID=A0A843XJ26_COLES|nr:hypothetical protein [Colocasia esculenta]